MRTYFVFLLIGLFHNLNGQLSIGFNYGVFKSGYYDLTDKSYGLGLQYQKSRFAIRIEYTRATADWRNYYHFLSLNREFTQNIFMPDVYPGLGLSIPFKDFKGVMESQRFSNVGSKNVVPPVLNSTIHLPSIDMIYYIKQKSKLNIGLVGSLKYIDNRISDDFTSFRTKIEIEVDGQKKIFDSFLIMQNFERQQEFGYGLGILFKYPVHDLVSLSIEGSMSSFKDTSTFSMATAKVICRL